MKHFIIPALIIFVSLTINAQTSNQPVNQDSGIKIRLISTTPISKAETPLYVVDGKIADTSYIKTIDPKSIVSVNILKGDKAIKKYGRKGENGVIIVTTKKDILLER